jgi:hypothetical protein
MVVERKMRTMRRSCQDDVLSRKIIDLDRSIHTQQVDIPVSTAATCDGPMIDTCTSLGESGTRGVMYSSGLNMHALAIAQGILCQLHIV